MNALFFNDSTMHRILLDEGDYNIIYQLPQIIYSSLISSLIKLLLTSLALTENNAIQIKSEKNYNVKIKNLDTMINNLNLKFTGFYSFNFLLLFFFWYYLSCFCALYPNTQIHLIKDTLISFAISLLIPFFINLIPGIFRIPSLKSVKTKREGYYKFSKILQSLF